MLLNETTMDDIVEEGVRLVKLTIKRFERCFTPEQIKALQGDGIREEIEENLYRFNKRERNMLILRALRLDEQAEPGWLARNLWFPLKRKLPRELQDWLTLSHPLKVITRTDDPLCLLDEYDQFFFTGDPVALMLFCFEDIAKPKLAERWDKSRRRVNCYGDDLVEAFAAEAAAKVIWQILIPKEQLEQLREEMTSQIHHALEGIVGTVYQHEKRWNPDLTQEQVANTVDGLLGEWGFRLLLKEVETIPPFMVDQFFRTLVRAGGGIPVTTMGHYYLRPPEVFRNIADEASRAMATALVGAAAGRVAHSIRSEEEMQFPEQFSRISPLRLLLLKMQVGCLRRREELTS